MRVDTVAVGATTRAASCTPEQLPQVAHAQLVDLVEAAPAALSATVVTVGPGPRVRPWATSGPAGADLDGVQAAAGAGPVVTAVADPDHVVVADQVWVDPRWALARTDRWSPVQSVVAIALPGWARVAVVQARLEAASLQRALDSNRTIGAAIGVTMTSQKLPYEAAAELLRSVSNHSNVRLVDLAENILFTGEVPGTPLRRARPRRPVPPTSVQDPPASTEQR